jgi:hypothetical protein
LIVGAGEWVGSPERGTIGGEERKLARPNVNL